jgi:cyclophilin family peptidyl-prolyl cis-trans isomerase
MNKKFFLLLFLAVFLSGCGSNPNLITEETAPENLQKYNEMEDVMKINEIKNGLTPNVKPNNQYKPNNMNENNQNEQENQNQEEEQNQLVELTEQYDSALIKTNLGDIKVKFYGSDSPITVNNFMNLAAKGFYDGIKFHRVIKDFMIQGGDPNSKSDDRSTHGTGGPGYRFQDEFNSHKLVKGSLAMANSGPDTNGSQFFIVTADSASWLDGKHTNFGEVIEGMDTVLKIEKVDTDENDNPIEEVVIKGIELLNSTASTESGLVGPEKPADEDIDLELETSGEVIEEAPVQEEENSTIEAELKEEEKETENDDPEIKE